MYGLIISIGLTLSFWGCANHSSSSDSETDCRNSVLTCTKGFTCAMKNQAWECVPNDSLKTNAGAIAEELPKKFKNLNLTPYFNKYLGDKFTIKVMPRNYHLTVIGTNENEVYFECSSLAVDSIAEDGYIREKNGSAQYHGVTRVNLKALKIVSVQEVKNQAVKNINERDKGENK